MGAIAGFSSPRRRWFAAAVCHDSGHEHLSLLPVMVRTAFALGDVRMSVEPIPGGAQLVVEVTTECEGHTKPVCVAESVARHHA